MQSDGGKAEMTVHNDRSLLALQGPKAMEVLQPHTDADLSKLYFSNFIKVDIAGVPCFLTRTGYVSALDLPSVQVSHASGLL